MVSVVDREVANDTPLAEGGSGEAGIARPVCRQAGQDPAATLPYLDNTTPSESRYFTCIASASPIKAEAEREMSVSACSVDAMVSAMPVRTPGLLETAAGARGEGEGARRALGHQTCRRNAAAA